MAHQTGGLSQMKIPLALILTVAPTLVGGVMWLSNVNSIATTTAARVEEMKLDDKEVIKELKEINQRLGRIEGKLKIRE